MHPTHDFYSDFDIYGLHYCAFQRNLLNVLILVEDEMNG